MDNLQSRGKIGMSCKLGMHIWSDNWHTFCLDCGKHSKLCEHPDCFKGVRFDPRSGMLIIQRKPK